MKKHALLLLAALAFLTGCGHTARILPPNPYEDIVTVAVAPFVNYTKTDLDEMKTGEIFASELVKFSGFRVIRPSVVIDTVRREGLKVETPEDAVALAKVLKADAIIIGAVTEFNPYYPGKVIGVSIQMFTTRKNTRSSADELQRLVRSGKPLEIRTEDQLRSAAAGFERIFDGENSGTLAKLNDFAASYEETNAVHKGAEAFLRNTDKYMMFVSNMMITELVETEMIRRAAAEEAAKKAAEEKR